MSDNPSRVPAQIFKKNYIYIYIIYISSYSLPSAQMHTMHLNFLLHLPQHPSPQQWPASVQWMDWELLLCSLPLWMLFVLCCENNNSCVTFIDRINYSVEKNQKNKKSPIPFPQSFRNSAYQTEQCSETYVRICTLIKPNKNMCASSSKKLSFANCILRFLLF